MPFESARNDYHPNQTAQDYYISIVELQLEGRFLFFLFFCFSLKLYRFYLGRSWSRCIWCCISRTSSWSRSNLFFFSKKINWNFENQYYFFSIQTQQKQGRHQTIGCERWCWFTWLRRSITRISRRSLFHLFENFEFCFWNFFFVQMKQADFMIKLPPHPNVVGLIGVTPPPNFWM